MNMPQQLNISCDFSGFLVCQIPRDVIEVKLKIKTKWRKIYPAEGLPQQNGKVQTMGHGKPLGKDTSRRRMPHQEAIESNTTSTDSGTYIPNGKGMGYPPKFSLILGIYKRE